MDKFTPEQLLDKDIMPVAVVSATPFRTAYNQSKFPRYYRKEVVEKLNGSHLTVPDQSLSVGELVRRFTHGLPLHGKEGFYDSESDFEFPANWEKYDLSEKAEWLEEKRQEVEAIQKKMADQKNRIEKEKRDKEIDEAVSRKLSQARQAINPRETPKLRPDAETD